MLCQSALFAYAASLIPEAIDVFRKNSIGYEKLEKQRAIAAGIVGGVSAVGTVDPIGGILVAVEVFGHINASRNNCHFEDRYKASFSHVGGHKSVAVADNPLAHLKGFDSPGGDFPTFDFWK